MEKSRFDLLPSESQLRMIKSFVLLADVPIQAIMIVLDETISQELIDENIPELADYIAADISNQVTAFSTPIFSTAPILQGGKCFSLSIKDAVAEIVDLLHVDTEALDVLFPVVLSETRNRIHRILAHNDVAVPGNEFDITLFFSQASNIDADLLQFQLQKYFVPLFGDSTSKILVESVNS